MSGIFSLFKKKWMIALIILILAGGGYYWYRKAASANIAPTYTVATATAGTLITDVNGSGQVSTLDQVDVKPQVSGTVLSVPVTQGQTVKVGDVLARLDATTAEQTVQNDILNLQDAELSLSKLTEPPDAATLLQAENNLASAEQSLQTNQDSLTTDYSDAMTTLTATFLDMPSVMAGVHDMFYQRTIAAGQYNVDFFDNQLHQKVPDIDIYRDDFESKYEVASTAYQQNFNDYQTISSSSSSSTIESFLNETYSTAQSVETMLKSALSYLQYYHDQCANYGLVANAADATYENTLNSDITTINGHVSALLSIINTIQSAKQDLVTASQSIAENSASLTKLQAGADPLDVASQKITIAQKQAALAQDRQNLSYYTVRAPIAGVAATVNVKPGDPASSGTAIASLIANQQEAIISLNEIDAAKIAIGQKAMLTFDAIGGLTISGTVAQIDSLGTVSQGVVTYNVYIVFDTEDNRVKPGMSVTANIVTKVESGVLLVPSTAIKTLGNRQYVEVFKNRPNGVDASATTFSSYIKPEQVFITAGDSNDTDTVVTSGLSDGDLVVTQTNQNIESSASSPASAPSLLGGGGRGRAMFVNHGGFGG